MADEEVTATMAHVEGKLEEVCRTFRNTGRCRFGDNCKYTHSEGEPIPAPPRVIKPRGVCFNWKEGVECKFGDRCRFFHGTEEEAEAECEARKASEAAKQARRDAGEIVDDDEGKRKRRSRRRRRNNGDGDEPREPPVVEHTADGQEICRNFKNRGKCRWGDNCNFAHVPGDNTFENDGQQENGGGRRRRRRKPKGPGICYSFRDNDGVCQYGDECHFKHGEDDNRDFEKLRAQRAPAGICYAFKDTGDCKFADNCRFSHDENAEDDRGQGEEQVDDAGEYDRSADV